MRYIPFTQQPYCCVPTCLQMVLYKNGIPLISQEELAYQLGLTVPKKDAHLFAKVRTGKKPSAGWGTQIQKPEFSIDKALAKHAISLKMEQLSTRDFKTPAKLASLLEKVEVQNGDALLCFDYGKLWGLDYRGGHVCVFDSIEGDTVRIIDPERNVPKLRETKIDKLWEAMDFHGEHNSTGVWLITPSI